MQNTLKDLNDYVVNDSLVNIDRDIFYVLEVRLVDSDEELTENEIQVMGEDEFISMYRNLVSSSSYGMYYRLDFKAFSVQLTKKVRKELFRTEDIRLVEHDLQFNLRLDEDGTVKSVKVWFDGDSYEELSENRKLKMAEMKKSFLNDLFVDSGLTDNEHNRLIPDKAWSVACNVDYDGKYMSTRFYRTVEIWFNELKSLSI